ncbi:UNVERIFIED_CONTAM: hypothetical protein Q9R71_24070 [Actinomycetes bacterium ARC8]|nr:hypothetical protein [Actinomycetes bacterium ARC8]
MTPHGTNKNWLTVAAAISTFWEGMEGPATSSTRSALGFAGVSYDELKGSNRQDRVFNAVGSSKPQDARRAIAELVSLLVEESYFAGPRLDMKKVKRLQRALQEVGGDLTDAGVLRWNSSSNPENVLLSIGESQTHRVLQEPAGTLTNHVQGWSGPSLETLLTVLQKLPQAATSLTHPRRKSRDKVQVWNEYDVQDFMEMALRMLYADVRAEEYGPSHGGVNSRVDFLIKQEKILVEAKVSYKGHVNAQIVKELHDDLVHYSQVPGITDLVCAVYDLDGNFKNPGGFKNDLEAVRVGDLRVHIIAAPWPFSDRITNDSDSQIFE